MKQPLALLLLVGAAIPFVFADASNPPVPPAPQAAAEIKIPELNYGAYQLGLKGGYDVGKSRCALDKAPTPLSMPYKTTAADMGDAICKHHVWNLLITEGEKKWNLLFVPEQTWKSPGGVGHRAPLAKIDAYFVKVDTAYKALLEAAKAVVAANADDAKRAKLWEANKPAAELLAYYKALAAFERELQAAAKDNGGIDAPTPEQVSDAFAVTESVFKVLQVVDNVMRENFTAVHSAVLLVHGAVSGKGGSVKATLGTDLGKWTQAVAKGGEYQAALDQMYTGEQAKAAREALAGARVLDDGKNKWLMQEIVVKGKPGKEPLIKTAKFVRLTDDSTAESVVRELMDNIKADEILNSKWAGFKAAAGEVASNPGQLPGDVANNIKTEQGPLAFMSGQTKPDMQKKIDQAAAEDSANALKGFTTNDVALKAEFERSWNACAAKWAELKRDQAAFAALPPLPANAPQPQKDRREAIRKELVARPLTFRADGPKGAKDALACTDGGAEIQAAFFAARDQAIAQVQTETAKIADRALFRREQDLNDRELFRKQKRRYYLRVKLLELHKDLEALVKTTSVPAIKEEIVDGYLAQVWSAGDKKEQFYLAGWKADAAEWKVPVLPPSPDPTRLEAMPAAAYDWMKRMTGDPKTSKEAEFLRAMEELYGFWRKNLITEGMSEEKEKEVIFSQVKPWVQADFKRYRNGADDPKPQQGGSGPALPKPPGWDTPLKKEAPSGEPQLHRSGPAAS